MKKSICFLLLCAATLSMAQSFREDGYVYYYDYDHRVVVRECTYCSSDYQDLWNGDYVRIYNGNTYIYRGSSRVLYGNKIWLEHTGDYTVENGSYQYLYDSYGHRTGVYGTTIHVLWNGVCNVQSSNGYWYLYNRDGSRLSGRASDTSISLYWNGCYCASWGGYYRVLDANGNYTNLYSDDEPSLTNAGYFRCSRSGYSYLYDINGNRVY